MPVRHPHADATYRVIQVNDASFAVEVSIPDSQPTTVHSFANKEAAEGWIEGHRRKVESQSQNSRWRRRI